jgi:hypothetical protein
LQKWSDGENVETIYLEEEPACWHHRNDFLIAEFIKLYRL